MSALPKRQRSFSFGGRNGLHARGRGKTRQDVSDAACFPAVTSSRRLVDRRLRLDGGDQVLIAAISGPTPRMVIIRLML